MEFRSRNFKAVLYPDEDITHKSALDFIIENYSYAYVVHDKDLNIDTNEIKKSHTHVVFCFQNARSSSSVSKELGIACNYLKPCYNLENDLKYLIHFNNNEKYQYGIEEVFGNLKEKLELSLSSCIDENQKVKELIDLIDDNHIVSVKEFSKHVYSLGYWDIFRRSSSIFISIINENRLDK